MSRAVLDSSALLAYVQGEKGAEFVLPLIGEAIISSVNFAEVLTKLIDGGMTREAASAALSVPNVDVADFDRELAEVSASLVTQTKKFGLSLGDRACLALAFREQLPAVTGDRAWNKLDVGVAIQLIR